MSVILREHPQMNYRDQVNWPPVWVHIRRVPLERLTGEIGVLTDANWYPEVPKRIFLWVTGADHEVRYQLIENRGASLRDHTFREG